MNISTTKRRFLDRRTRRIIRHARILQKRWKGSHMLWTALGKFAIERGRHWGTSAWDGVASGHLSVQLYMLGRP